MLDAFRAVKAGIYRISSYQVFGFQIDTGLHLIFAFLIFVFSHRLWGKRVAFYVCSALIVLKEIADVFLKSRIDYVRPPKLDLLYDVTFGILGIILGYFFVQWRPRRRSTGAETDIDLPVSESQQKQNRK